MENKKLTMREIIYYGIRGITTDVYLQFIALPAIVLYADVLGISIVLTGLIFTGSRVFDGIDNIAMGYTSDRYGHYKRWIPYGFIAMAVIFAIMFMNFHLDTKIQSVYALVTFCFWILTYTRYVIPFNAFASIMTQNTEERTLLNSIRFTIVTIPPLIVSLATPYLESSTQKSDSIYDNVVLVFVVITAAYTLVCAAGIVERTKAPTARQRTSGREYFKATLKNRRFLVVSAVFFCRALGYYIYPSPMAYYFNCCLGSAKLMGIILGISTPISAVAALCMAPVSRCISKKKALMGCGVISALPSVIRYFMLLNTAVVAVICWVGMFVMSATLAIFFTMIADTTDYGMWFTGKNVRAVSYGFYTFCQKIGVTFSDATIGIPLDTVGYIPNQQRADAILRSVLNIYCLISAAIYLIMTAFTLLWKLDEGRMYEIVAELEVRRRLETDD